MALIIGCSKKSKDSSPPSSAPLLPTHAQPRLPTIRLWLGTEELITEMALTGEQQMTGMMFRTNIAENEAMIFVHPAARQASYWMTNCFVPLSIAYIDTDGVILEIHNLQPHNVTPVISAATNVRFGLETSQGWFQRHNVSTGAVIRTERGSLAQTFLRRP
ncbi:MAG: DUF192 domain-containing protein [Verrucomicrobia bacterium]|nr:DUF192 domain-containing protein [Verrucomicrobiota bacterium]